MMKKLIAFVAWPYNAGKSFVDTRPSINAVREHLNQVELVVVPTQDDRVKSASLRVKSTGEVSKELMQIDITTTPELNESYFDGLQKGFALATEVVQNATRHELNMQNKAIRAADKLEKAEAKAEAVANEPFVLTPVPAHA
jgi:hypothetical protein